MPGSKGSLSNGASYLKGNCQECLCITFFLFPPKILVRKNIWDGSWGTHEATLYLTIGQLRSILFFWLAAAFQGFKVSHHLLTSPLNGTARDRTLDLLHEVLLRHRTSLELVTAHMCTTYVSGCTMHTSLSSSCLPLLLCTVFSVQNVKQVLKPSISFSGLLRGGGKIRRGNGDFSFRGPIWGSLTGNTVELSFLWNASALPFWL